jgi:hypothetical protein
MVILSETKDLCPTATPSSRPPTLSPPLLVQSSRHPIPHFKKGGPGGIFSFFSHQHPATRKPKYIVESCTHCTHHTKIFRTSPTHPTKFYEQKICTLFNGLGTFFIRMI